jgi:hypothetical protein
MIAFYALVMLRVVGTGFALRQVEAGMSAWGTLVHNFPANLRSHVSADAHQLDAKRLI